VKPVKEHLHIISPFGIVFPIEMVRLFQMYIIEFVIRMVARKLRVVVGHFIVARVSVLGLPFLIIFLRSFLAMFLAFFFFLAFLLSRAAFLAASPSPSLISSSLESESESDDESSELSMLDGVRLGAFPVRSTLWAALSSLSEDQERPSGQWMTAPQ
jgi:uncharacterized protein YacL